VLFLGSSTIARLSLEAHFPGKPAANLGLGSETARELAERLPKVLPAAAPAGIVLYAGGADLRFEKLGAADIRKRVEAILDLLAARYPGAPVVLLEVLPGRSASEAERAALADLNRELGDLARARSVIFVRTHRPPLVTDAGALAEALTTDRYHLNDAGYEHLARWIVEDGGAVGALLR
jgi:lysophospholipase L1-like esterase